MLKCVERILTPIIMVAGLCLLGATVYAEEDLTELSLEQLLDVEVSAVSEPEESRIDGSWLGASGPEHLAAAVEGLSELSIEDRRNSPQKQERPKAKSIE